MICWAIQKAAEWAVTLKWTTLPPVMEQNNGAVQRVEGHSRLFLYVRGLNSSSFRSKPETSSPLMLNEKAQTSFTAYDHRRLTPVERVIADK